MKIRYFSVLGILLILSFNIVFSQKQWKEYAEEWINVETFVSKGLPKSALEIVEKIKLDAGQTGNSPQFLKACLYKIKLISTFEENYLKKAIESTEKEIILSKNAEKAILHSMLAELYWNYYNMNRYKILQISNTANFENDDIETWSINKFVDISIKNYYASIMLSDEIKNIPLQQWNTILEKNNYDINLRPTLYDFLAQRFIDFLANEEASLTKPFDSFEIKNSLFLSDATTFSKIKVSTSDTISFAYHTVKIYQDLIRFHLNDKNPDALIDIDLQRLKYILNKSSIQDKEKKFLNTLEQLESKYANLPISTDITFEIASFYYDNKLSASKPDYKRAMEYCDKAIQRFPESNGAIKCSNLKYNIQQPSLSFSTENCNLPEKPFLASVSYKNLQKIYFRIIPVSPEKNRSLTQKLYSKELINEYLKIKPISSFERNVLNLKDYQQYSTEVIIPEVKEKGHYVLLASTSADFGCKDEIVVYRSFWITNISYLSRYNNDGSLSYYVLERESGNPIANASITAYLNEYDYKTRTTISKVWKKFTSDQNGYFEIPKLSGNENTYKNFYLVFRKNDDMLLTDEYFYQNYLYTEPERNNVSTYFFTDRAIYRPGQYVYFKGIMVDKQKQDFQILPNKKTLVTFYDVNGQKISDLNLITNEFGSFSGNFQIPIGLLNGTMRIGNESGNTFFSVEDYKRPKFEVKIEKPQGNYRLNEEITVTGFAKSFSGSNIDGAEVKYRVQRRAYFPYIDWWWRGSLPSSAYTEISNGVTKTNPDGSFSIKFTAKADENIKKNLYPYFDFIIKADITDINGETRSDEQIITIAYQSLNINVDINNPTDKKSLATVPISVNNMSGLPQKAKLVIEIYKLKTPINTYIDRLWQKPEIQIINENEFKEKFPLFEYNDENDITKWEADKKMLSAVIDYPQDSVLKIDDIASWQQGSYRIEVSTKDSYGESVEFKKYFTLFSAEDKTMPENNVFWVTTIKKTAEHGEEAAILIGSSIKNARVLYEVEVKDKIIKKEWIELNEEKKKINIPIEEEHRGNIFVHLTMVKNNRFYKHKQTIVVPFTNKKLNVTFQSFRNKLLPGQNEEWRLTVKGSKGEKVAAEMLAALYDASLDAIKPHDWIFQLYNDNFSRYNWAAYHNFDLSVGATCFISSFKPKIVPDKLYPELNWFGLNFYGYAYGIRGQKMGGVYSIVEDSKPVATSKSSEGMVDTRMENNGDEEFEIAQNVAGDKVIEQTVEPQRAKSGNNLQIRRNFNETAFFYPQLRTNENGDIVIAFKIPEALTRWKMMGLAHTKQLESGYITNELITQKELMLTTNPPRFFREGDTIFFSTKVTNLTDKSLYCNVLLSFYDALTMAPIDGILQEATGKATEIKPNQSSIVNWKLIIPQGYQALVYRLEASSGVHSDGEEMAIPVLTNRILVTETMPLWVNANKTKSFTFNKLKQSGSSSTLKHHKLTLEFTSNPVWYAIQALPYLMEYPYDCNEQIFSRYYANSLATFIANSNPKIKNVFESWKSSSSGSFLSNLEKNQELKSLLIEETPWLLQAKNESERKKMIALLFDLNKMASELESAKLKLIRKQLPNGGWSWFSGGRDDHYITQYIVCGFGHLKQLKVLEFEKDYQLKKSIQNAIGYIDNRMKEYYDNLKKWNSKELDKNHLTPLIVHYIYTRSFFKNNFGIPSSCSEAYNYFLSQTQKYWVALPKYQQGMIALALHRAGISGVPSDIISSLKESALYSEELGMYWRDITSGYYWYQNPIETMSLMTEVFDEVAKDNNSVEKLKIWLLKNKQTNDWKTTKATANAIYAILLKGTDFLNSDKLVDIKVGGSKIVPDYAESRAEAGTGYFQHVWNKNEINDNLANVEINNPNDNIAWGAMYWQYFEQLDKITAAKTPLSLNKRLFVQRLTPSGKVIEPLTEKVKLNIGDKITVRIELRVDRDMEYVHLKDMRAASFEPVNTISAYKWQNGIGYYESTRDAAVNFFISFLPKGTFVFEYELIASQKGYFSNGISTIQCMYAPEFSSHSEGIRVKVQ